MFVRALLLGISTTTNPSLPKYGDIDVFVFDYWPRRAGVSVNTAHSGGRAKSPVHKLD